LLLKLIVGLGNPGQEYKETKHNVGFWVIDFFASREGLSLSDKKGKALVGRGSFKGAGEEIQFLLAKPQTFMNRSGESVREILTFFKIPLSNLIVIYDDLDLELGRIRVRTQGRSGGHRGIESIIAEVGSDQFVRVKIGIGRDPRWDAADYVLAPFKSGEKETVLQAVEKTAEMLPLLAEGKIAEAMNRYHTD
jgi:PTH1 family peptidyl-tRNA hydrolase